MKILIKQSVNTLIYSFIFLIIVYPLYSAVPAVQTDGVWSISAKSAYSAAAKIYFNVFFKKNMEGKTFADVERRGGFLRQKNIPVTMDGNLFSFTYIASHRQYHFSGNIEGDKLTGEYLYKEDAVSKGKYSFHGKKILKDSPVRNVSGNYEFGSGMDYRLKLTMNGNSVSGFLLLRNNTVYSVTGTIYGNQISFYRSGYDWYELFVASSVDKGINFKGKIIRNDRTAENFSMKNTSVVIPPIPRLIPKPLPVVFTPPVVKNWAPVKKSKWGGYIILELGRMNIWWLDSDGIAHPIYSKRLLEKYGETVFNINFAPRNIGYLSRFKIGFSIDNEHPPMQVKGKIWKDTSFVFDPLKGTVVNEEGTNQLWYIHEGTAHWIENEKVFLKHWQDKSKIQKVPYGHLNHFTIGPNIMEN